MSIARRLYASIGANITGQAVTIAIQVLSVPVFLHYWGMETYGEWLLLAAIPAYFALADVGFVSIAINKMTILVAGGDVDGAERVFHTAIKLTITVTTIIFLLALCIIPFFNYGLLGVIGNKIAVLILIFTALIAISSGLFDAVFRSCGEYAYGTHITNGARLLEWIGLIIGLGAGESFISAALGQLIGRALAFIGNFIFTIRRHPQFRWGTNLASKDELYDMARPSLAFMAFPLANAISIQGMTILVSVLHGPAVVVIFNTYRTLSRILVQAITILGRSLWPEISRQFGLGNIKKIITIYHRGTVASVAIGFFTSFFVYIFAPAILEAWTAGEVPFNKSLFTLFLFSTVLTAFWQMGMVVLSATNRHSGFSAVYLALSGGGIIAALTLNSTFDIYSPIIALILFEVAMIAVVFFYMRKHFKSPGSCE